MKFCSRIICLCACMVFAVGTSSAAKRTVLFIGNSYTYTNNMPLMLQTMTAALGDTLVYDESDPGGYTLSDHLGNPATISKIFAKQWDIVVLQEQSQLPAFPPTEVDTEVYPYAHALDSIIHTNDSCTQTMFLMTWGHANGDPMNCGTYPAICTYDGMQQRLRESYLQMALDNHAIVAPVGAAWKLENDSIPSLWLYMADSSHPVAAGSYLEACVLYASIFHKKTYGCSYTAGLSVTDAQRLQHIADKVTLDSLWQWQQYGHYPYAGFSFAQGGSTASFTRSSLLHSGFSWQFGDGTGDTGAAPVHTYAANGSYTVAHTAYNSCFSETFTQVLHIGTTGISSAAGARAYPVIIRQSGNGYVTFVLPAAQQYHFLEILDGQGRQIKIYHAKTENITDKFAPGCYMLHAFSSDRQYAYFDKLIVY